LPGNADSNHRIFFNRFPRRFAAAYTRDPAILRAPRYQPRFDVSRQQLQHPARSIANEIPARIIDVSVIYGVSRERSSAKLFHIDFQVGWPALHRCPHATSPQTHCGFQALIYARPNAFPPFPLDV